MALASLLVILAVALVLAMTMAWAIQWASHNVGWVDVVWTFATGLAGVAVALVPLGAGGPPNLRQVVVAALVALWSLRLGLYVARRVASHPEDARYVNLRQEWGAGFQRHLFWFLEIQAVCSWFLAVAILVAAHHPAPFPRPLDLAGIAVLIVAILGEAVADRQLQRFKADPANHGRLCTTGLWSWSRHPNYFFEWFGWLAYPLFAIDLHGGFLWGWLALLGPILMYLVLVYGTGLPYLEDRLQRSRGPEFTAYRQRTNAFFPAPPRRSAATLHSPEAP